MRIRRYTLLLLAVYYIFIGGSPYYTQFFAVRAAHHVIMTVVLGWWLLTRLRRGLPAAPVNRAVFALIAVWGIASLAGLDPRVSLETSWSLLVNVILLFVFIDLFQQGYQALVYEVQFFIAALIVILSVYNLVSWYFGLGLFPGTDSAWISTLPLQLPRLFAPMGVSTWLAGYTAPLTILSFAWGSAAKKPAARSAYYALAVSLLIVTLLTVSRGGLIALAGGGGVLVALRILPRWKRLARRTRTLMLAGGGLALIALAAGGVIIARNPERMIGDALRVDLWSSAAAIGSDHLLLGVGPGQFGRALRDYRNPSNVDDRLTTAHNLYLNTFAEIGLIGLVAVSAVLVVGALSAWRRVRSVTDAAAQWRLYGAAAALIAFGLHSVVDTFTLPALVTLPILLGATLVSARQTDVPRPAPLEQRIGAAALLAMLLAYGAAFVQWDRAHAAFNQSVRSGSLDAAREAQALDPQLKLYSIQVNYLTALQSDDLPTQIAAYEAITALEPTWDLAWMNLGALYERQGNIPAALDAFQQANSINHENGANLHWARLAEQAERADPDAIVNGYFRGYWTSGFLPLPLSEFWSMTPLRERARDQIAELLGHEAQYRVYAVIDPERAAALVPSDPVEAGDWWIKGEAVLAADPARAVEYFSEAIRLAPYHGDYYAARARAYLAVNPSAALQDLDAAAVFGTYYEFPNATRAVLAATDEERRQFQLAALPPLIDDQNFEGVLYLGRVGSFTLLPEARRPGPGTPVLAPWYALAEDFAATGHTSEAMQMYQIILAYAPEERAAENALRQLEAR